MTKADLHALVDALPEDSIDAVGVLLRRAQDPIVAKLDAAPNDDEALTPDDRRAIEEAMREPGVPLEQVTAELETD